MKEILDAVGTAPENCDTVVIQAGEDPGLSREFIREVVMGVKQETGWAITLSLGERSEAELRDWKAAGADRYLLRFETSNPELYAAIHPGKNGKSKKRLELLSTLKRLGYQVGSGIMVGIPGQTFETLSEDIRLLGALDLYMAGIGPFIAHPQTPLGTPAPRLADQVPNSVAMTRKVVALTRTALPGAHLPSTTALSTIAPGEGRQNGLDSGANVVMVCITPSPYREYYSIYPGKTDGLLSPDQMPAS